MLRLFWARSSALSAGSLCPPAFGRGARILIVLGMIMCCAWSSAWAEIKEGTYRIVNLSNRKVWHWDASNDQLISTRYQVDDEFTRFELKYFAKDNNAFNILTAANGKKLNACKEFKWYPDEVDQPNPDDLRISTLPTKTTEFMLQRYPDVRNEETFVIKELDGAIAIATTGSLWIWSKRDDGIISRCPPDIAKLGEKHYAEDLAKHQWFCLIDKDAMPGQAATVTLKNQSSKQVRVRVRKGFVNGKFEYSEINVLAPGRQSIINTSVSNRVAFYDINGELLQAVDITRSTDFPVTITDNDFVQLASRSEEARKRATEEMAKRNKPVDLFAEAYTVPVSLWMAKWTGETNPENHENVMIGTYPLKSSATFKANVDDPTVAVTGAGGGILRHFEDLQTPVQLSMEASPRGDDTSVGSDSKNNKVTLINKLTVELRSNSRCITLSDASTFVNSHFRGPNDKGNNTAVGFYLEGVKVKFTRQGSDRWGTPSFPVSANAQVGYNVSNTKEVNVEVGGGGAGGSTSKGSSSNVADYKFRGELADDGKSPVMTWSLGNVYDGDDNAIPYKSFQDVIHRTTIGQVDRVVDVPPLAKGTFIPTAFAGWTTSVGNVQEDFQVLVEYELTYREVHLKGTDAATDAAKGFARGFSFLFNREFYEDPAFYFSNPNTSYATTKIVQKFSNLVTIKKDDITRGLPSK